MIFLALEAAFIFLQGAMLCCLVTQALVVLQCLVSLSKAAQNVIPFALVVPPSQQWYLLSLINIHPATNTSWLNREGNDGPWSSFSLQVGSPAQDLTVLISTASNQPLVALPDGCALSNPSTCQSGRGGLFNLSSSTTWYTYHYIRIVGIRYRSQSANQRK